MSDRIDLILTDVERKDLCQVITEKLNWLEESNHRFNKDSKVETSLYKSLRITRIKLELEKQYEVN